jgi:hypothetical protein
METKAQRAKEQWAGFGRYTLDSSSESKHNSEKPIVKSPTTYNKSKIGVKVVRANGAPLYFDTGLERYLPGAYYKMSNIMPFPCSRGYHSCNSWMEALAYSRAFRINHPEEKIRFMRVRHLLSTENDVWLKLCPSTGQMPCKQVCNDLYVESEVSEEEVAAELKHEWLEAHVTGPANYRFKIQFSLDVNACISKCSGNARFVPRLVGDQICLLSSFTKISQHVGFPVLDFYPQVCTVGGPAWSVDSVDCITLT